MTVQFVNPSSIHNDMSRTGIEIREMVAKHGKPVKVTVTLARRMKTIAQLRYYHLLLNLVEEHTGEGVDYMKVKLKDQLGYYNEYVADGVTLKDYKSLADADIETLTVFIHATQDVCDFLELEYPHPEDFYKSIGYQEKVEKEKPVPETEKSDSVTAPVVIRYSYNFELSSGSKGTYQTDCGIEQAKDELEKQFIGRTVVAIKRSST